ncbi:hypothetical protein Amsp01_002080 [Amycolatopsis sp. NBRC 101858]|uniref:hypothetical protein n=1 Tax=Amycolatopsis sp. NBRC 101858 TaxID=3032200 RepID=UPI0024A2899E|nr:hypothetical protein [Amycolatopsis sp. NBRC 101858]GLY34184.1 hypothetical protein Amsp01_002080 [Amycolatopsis sp. NBRC 101858]
MPRLITAVEDTVDVEYGQFVLQELPLVRNALSLSPPAGPWIGVGGPGGLLLHSAATDHAPAVRLETWDSAPPGEPDSAAWDHVLELACDLTTEVRLQSVTAAPGDHTLSLPRPGPHRARVHVGNQRGTAQLGEGSFATGIERWLIQLWPA